MDDLKRFPNHPGYAVTTLKLIQLLQGRAGVGEVITDEAAAAECGEDTRPGGKGYAHLCSAIRYVLRNDHVVWERVRGGAAIKCLNSSENLEGRESGRSRIKRMAGRELRKAGCIKLDQLDGKDRQRALALMAQLGTLSQFSKSDATRAMESRGITKALDLSSTLRLIGGAA